MKQVSFLLLFILLGSGYQSLNAQQNAVKLNLLALTTSTISLDYERKIAPRLTADIRFNYFYGGNALTRVINTVDFIADQVDGDSFRYTSKVDKFKGIFFTPGLRFYPKEAFRGFYLEPNFRYGRYSFTGEYEFEDEEDEMITYVEEAPVVIQLLGGGLNIGAQKVFDNGFTMDFFLGAGFGNIKFNVESQDNSKLTETQLADLKEIIDDAAAAGSSTSASFYEELFFDNIEASVVGNKVKASFAGVPWPIGRVGFSLGYAF